MEEVMWDMAQADQYATLYIAKDSAKIDRKTETIRLYEAVFRLHQVTREEFTRSYHYYLNHPEKNQAMFDSIVVRGTQARTEMYDRPFYHPAAVPRSGVPADGKPAGGVYGQGYPGSLGGKYGQGALGRPVPGAMLKPGEKMPGAMQLPRPAQGGAPGMVPDAIMRMRETMMRRSRDSVARANQAKVGAKGDSKVGAKGDSKVGAKGDSKVDSTRKRN
jgi:hypothetical protein